MYFLFLDTFFFFLSVPTIHSLHDNLAGLKMKKKLKQLTFRVVLVTLYHSLQMMGDEAIFVDGNECGNFCAGHIRHLMCVTRTEEDVTLFRIIFVIRGI